MKITSVIVIGLATTLFLAGCVSKPIALSVVGPEPASRATADSKGCLQVFSATEKSPPVASDDSTFFNLHTGYDINDESGKCVKFVPNHASNMDESPDVVSLPAGHYNIVAESTCCGQVIVPVVIQNGKSTIVHLDRNWWVSAKTSTNQWVYLPDGEVVGWKGSIVKSSD